MAEAGTLHDAFIDELRDVYDAEKQLTKALPKLAKAATSDELREAFETPKGCEASCTIACVRRASALDEWRPQARPARPPKTVTHLPVL